MIGKILTTIGMLLLLALLIGLMAVLVMIIQILTEDRNRNDEI